ncbi:uncharacterized protein LOC107981181 [Nasonia vitripennis]|uniref:Uncharacterized protein n=1 Tax=Nasonia vitripennis TaxID=7425 RepID=A0A7M7M2A0_NASVI|nr:uncharacterized protein LOC107981181 [Nasonia vitripennis]
MVRNFVSAILIVQEITFLTGIIIKGTSESPLKTLLINLNSSENLNRNLKNTLEPGSIKYDSIKNNYFLNSIHHRNPIKIISPTIVTTNAKYHTANLSKNVLRRNLVLEGLKLSDTIKPIYETEYKKDIYTPLIHNFTDYIYNRPYYDKLTSLKGDFMTMPAYHSSQELTNAVLSLDRYLKPLLNEGSYNSAVHQPINPVLALVLSRYGKYIAGRLSPAIHSYMAVNNIHNNKPFGQYKYENDDDNVYTK